MAFGIRLKIDPVREIAFGSISGTYTNIGGPTTDHTRFLRIVNSTDAEMYISFNKISNHIRMAASSFVLYDISSNGSDQDDLFLSVGTSIYVKQVAGAPTTGSVWVEILSADRGV